MSTKLIDTIDLDAVRDHFETRQETSNQLRVHLLNKDVVKYGRLALGILDSSGNYSASEHKLGPRILQANNDAVFRLATALNLVETESEMLETIYGAGIRYLKISVGSEMAMMLRPNKFWVANVRSVWAHLLVKHEFNLPTANNALALYRDDDRTSEMDYRIWKSIYKEMRQDLVEIGQRVSNAAMRGPLETSSLYL